MENKIKNFLQSLPFINQIIESAEESGLPVFIVGGFIRDIILDRISLLDNTSKKEIDFLIVGDPFDFVNIFSKRLNVNQINIFKNYGTAHFVYYDNINEHTWQFEFVGARKESYSGNSRKPLVSFGTFEDDINRRDFTINTIAVAVNKINFGVVIDVYNGIEDIKNKIIKTTLEPEKTFDDDPLRIMRCVRFSAQLGFDIHPTLIDAAESMRERLAIVSQERITDEFLKILASPTPSIGLIVLYKTKVLEIIFPELAKLGGVEQRNDFHHKDVFYHTCEVVDNISKNTDNIWLRFAALVHDIAKPPTKKFIEGIGWTFHGHEDLGARMMKGIFHRLKLPLHKLDYVKNLVRLHLRPIALVRDNVTDSAIRRFIVDVGEDLDDLIILCRADITSKNPDRVKEYLKNYDKVIAKVYDVRERDRLRMFQSPVRGDEIMRICNIPPSKTVGLIKKDIENAILDGLIPNEYEAAFKYFLTVKDKYITSE